VTEIGASDEFREDLIKLTEDGKLTQEKLLDLVRKYEPVKNKYQVMHPFNWKKKIEGLSKKEQAAEESILKLNSVIYLALDFLMYIEQGQNVATDTFYY
jgi:hypothetical protein